MNYGLPLTKANPWYPGPFGIRGADSALGSRTRSTGIVLYVDRGHANASDSNDGTSPDAPLLTINTAVQSTMLVAGSMIVIAPGTYAENVVIAATRPNNVTVVGAGNDMMKPVWNHAAGINNVPMIDVFAWGWEFSNLYLMAPTAQASMRLNWHQGAAVTGANLTYVHDCFFDGAWDGLWGVLFHGAPGDCRIVNNEFKEFHNAGTTASAICVDDSHDATALETLILGNNFLENDRHISRANAAGSFSSSLIQGNVFHAGFMIPCNTYLDVRAGNNNIITGNYFGGDYSNPGGYFDLNSEWVGNTAADVTEIEVADNGFTVAAPAA